MRYLNIFDMGVCVGVMSLAHLCLCMCLACALLVLVVSGRVSRFLLALTERASIWSPDLETEATTVSAQTPSSPHA